MKETKKLTIMIVDDHALFREGIKRLLSEHKDFQVIGEAVDGKDAVEKAKDLKPEIILMDISMPRLNGIEATRKIVKEQPNTKVIAVTMYDNEDYVFQILKAGASGYILKDEGVETLAEGIRSVLQGDPYFSPSISKILLNGYLRKKGAPEKGSKFELLTNREREILQLIAEGHRNKEMANLLGLSVKTVEVHRAHIMNKLEIHNIPELVKYAIQKGLIKIE